jgi:hypothetical protein
MSDGFTYSINLIGWFHGAARRAITMAQVTRHPWFAIALACAHFGAVHAADPVEARTTVTVLGKEVLRARATSASGPVADWEISPIGLEITALVKLEGRQLGEQAARRMVDEEGLAQDRADRFEASLAALNTLAPGQRISAECRPGAGLLITAPSQVIEIPDATKARAFCGLWFSLNGDQELRKGLGLR